MDDYIRSLCHKLIEVDENSAEFKTAASELQVALFKQIEQIRMRLKDYSPAKEKRSINT